MSGVLLGFRAVYTFSKKVIEVSVKFSGSVWWSINRAIYKSIGWSAGRKMEILQSEDSLVGTTWVFALGASIGYRCRKRVSIAGIGYRSIKYRYLSIKYRVTCIGGQSSSGHQVSVVNEASVVNQISGIGQISFGYRVSVINLSLTTNTWYPILDRPILDTWLTTDTSWCLTTGIRYLIDTPYLVDQIQIRNWPRMLN